MFSWSMTRGRMAFPREKNRDTGLAISRSPGISEIRSDLKIT